MKLLMHNRTPRQTPPTWMRAVLGIYFSLFAAVMTWVCITLFWEGSLSAAIVVASVLFAVCLLLAAHFYNLHKAYIEIEHGRVTCVTYCFFCKRQRVVLLQDVTAIKRRMFGTRALYAPYLLFQNERNKTLFLILDSPEARACFERLGFRVG